MVITIGAVFIGIFINCHILPKRLLAFLTHEYHLSSFGEWVIRFLLCVTFGTLWKVIEADELGVGRREKRKGLRQTTSYSTVSELKLVRLGYACTEKEGGAC